MSAFEDLKMFYKDHGGGGGHDPKIIEDPWALGSWLARTHGKHSAAEYARALEDKRDAKTWNPVSGAYKAKKKDSKKKAAASEKKPRKKAEGKQGTFFGQEGMGRKKDYAAGGQRAAKSLDKSWDDDLNLLLGELALMKEEEKIKEDDKDEHEDKEPIKDPFAVASWRAEREGHDLSTDEGKDRRKEIVEDIKEEGNIVGKKKKEEDKDIKKAVPMQKISPSLAGLMAAAAGWALSDSIVEAGGGSPRGNMTPHQLREWERTVRRSMRKNDTALDKESWDKLQKTYYDDSDLYFRKVPVQNGVTLSKDHAPVPPRQGLMWDELKKKWTTPEHLGKTVIEVQGKKRIRGSGTGVHEHALHAGKAGGKGEGSGVAGRRFRSVGDAGVLKPHESKHTAGYSKHETAKANVKQHAKSRAQQSRMASHARTRLRGWGGPVNPASLRSRPKAVTTKIGG